MQDELTDDQLHRYARHVILDEVGEEGQLKLLDSKVLVIGAGGLGAPVLLYLAAAGVGTLACADDDAVDLSNLQRQIIHRTESVGIAKVESARQSLEAVNPTINFIPIAERINRDNAADLVSGYDLVVDGSDNFDTRYLLNDVCLAAGIPWISGSLLRFEGQVSTFMPHRGAGHPCYRCIFPERPEPGSIPRCDEAGIFGSVAGIVGTIQATEALKILMGLGETLSGRLLLIDTLAPRFTTIKVPKDPGCPCCGVRSGADES
ncbi:MAG: molybdopterin-synthase adenylyltransferase MoeB [Alphaproteobacteria bacterium]|nr:molybdopterin-synthase adenylyltransferase MoeB [Alphaproteobacteria bacterium]